jgi:hypothetical protein
MNTRSNPKDWNVKWYIFIAHYHFAPEQLTGRYFLRILRNKLSHDGQLQQGLFEDIDANCFQ